MTTQLVATNARSGFGAGSSNSSGISSKTSPTMEQMLMQMANDNSAKTFEFNRSEAQKARDWQTDMSNTSHQREVDDLRAAGLNPVLSANGGAAAYSTSSASGSADSSAIGALASIYQNKMNNENAVKLAQMTNKNNLEIAKIQAAASNYASDNAYSASRYASDNSYYASKYNTDVSSYTSNRNSERSYKATGAGMLDDVFGNDSKYAKGAKVGFGALSSLIKLFK